MMWQTLVSLCIALSWFAVRGYQQGDRVVASSISQHLQTRTDWQDLSLDLLPRFGVDDSVIFHAKVPHWNENATEHRIHPKHDLSVSLSFDFHHHSLPWLTVFSAQQRHALKLLTVTFTKNQFEIVKVDYQTTCEHN
jgi:hypothetical protein